MGEREESYQAYPQTLLAFEGGPRLDLRRPLSRDERQALRAAGLGDSFAVLTAESPGGAEPEAGTPALLAERERANVRRILRLEEHLARHGLRFRRVDGSAPDGTHRERCVAVALAREEAEGLARGRDQVALFWYDGERFWLWSAKVADTPQPLPA